MAEHYGVSVSTVKEVVTRYEFEGEPFTAENNRLCYRYRLSKLKKQVREILREYTNGNP